MSWTNSPSAMRRSIPSPPGAGVRQERHPAHPQPGGGGRRMWPPPSSKRWWTRPWPVPHPGPELKGTIVFLGGPSTSSKACGSGSWTRSTWTATTPSSPGWGLLAAIGAALCTEAGQTRPFEEVLDLLEHAANVASPWTPWSPSSPLRLSTRPSAARHQAMTVPRLDLSTYTGPAYLGIDAYPPPPRWSSSTRRGASS